MSNKSPQTKMKKEDVQKIVLGVLMALGIVYGYFTLLLGPLKTKLINKQKSVAALRPEILKAKGQIAKFEELQKNLPATEATIKQVEALIPDGSPVAWFPTLVADFFKKHSIDKVTTRMAADVEDKEIAPYRKIAWNIELPKTEAMSFAAAVANMENELLLVEIQGIVIETQTEDPQHQRVTLSVTNIAKK